MATQAERRSATITAIDEAARRLFAERGFAATSVNDVATAAGVAKGGVYHHYENKERLFEKVFRTVEQELFDRVAATTATSGSGVDLLVEGTRTFLDRCLDPDVFQIVLVDGPKVLGWETWRAIDATHFLPPIIGALHLDAGDDPRIESLARLILGAADEAVRMLAAADDPAPVRDQLMDSLELMLRSVASSLAAGPAADPADPAAP
jgi:AcrR family transcriptional regulator